MMEKTIQFESTAFQFTIDDRIWRLMLAKSQTHVKSLSQLALITEKSDFFVPVEIDEDDDSFTFSFTVNPSFKRWDDVRKLKRHDKLRLLCNVARFEACLSSRLSFFLHPDNVIFDDNLIPRIVYRGIRGRVPPYEMDKNTFLTQYKCFIVALFSKKYTFDELYAGSLQHAKETEFERRVGEIGDFPTLVKFLEESYRKEQRLTEENMQLVPTRRFRLFKQLSISMVVLVILLAVPLTYFGLAKVPTQEKLLAAHRDFLATDYDKVISDLERQDPEKLSTPAKYVLAYSYVKVEKLSDNQKEAIMNNISLKSDPNYLLYWIYNGRGDFEKSTDLAQFIDDPQLIMYGLIKQIEQAKNDPSLSGSEREERVQTLQEQLNTYRETYVQDEDDVVTDPEVGDDTHPSGDESTPAENPSDEENIGDVHAEEAERDTEEDTDEEDAEEKKSTSEGQEAKDKKKNKEQKKPKNKKLDKD